MTDTATEQRPKRICDVCGGIDDHPRHVFAAAPEAFPVNHDHIQAVLSDPSLTIGEQARLVAEIADTSIQQRHMDCCRAAGCPDHTCAAIAATGAADLRGADLLAHLTSGAVDGLGEN